MRVSSVSKSMPSMGGTILTSVTSFTVQPSRSSPGLSKSSQRWMCESKPSQFERKGIHASATVSLPAAVQKAFEPVITLSSAMSPSTAADCGAL